MPTKAKITEELLELAETERNRGCWHSELILCQAVALIGKSIEENKRLRSKWKHRNDHLDWRGD